MNDFFTATMFWLCAGVALALTSGLTNTQTTTAITRDCEALGSFRVNEMVYECHKREPAAPEQEPSK